MQAKKEATHKHIHITNILSTLNIKANYVMIHLGTIIQIK